MTPTEEASRFDETSSIELSSFPSSCSLSSGLERRCGWQPLSGRLLSKAASEFLESRENAPPFGTTPWKRKVFFFF